MDWTEVVYHIGGQIARRGYLVRSIEISQCLDRIRRGKERRNLGD